MQQVQKKNLLMKLMRRNRIYRKVVVCFTIARVNLTTSISLKYMLERTNARKSIGMKL